MASGGWQINLQSEIELVFHSADGGGQIRSQMLLQGMEMQVAVEDDAEAGVAAAGFSVQGVRRAQLVDGQASKLVYKSGRQDKDPTIVALHVECTGGGELMRGRAAQFRSRPEPFNMPTFRYPSRRIRRPCFIKRRPISQAGSHYVRALSSGLRGCSRGRAYALRV